MRFSVETKYRWDLTKEEDRVVQRALNACLENIPLDAEMDSVVRQILNDRGWSTRHNGERVSVPQVSARDGASLRLVTAEEVESLRTRSQVHAQESIVTAEDLRRPTDTLPKPDLSQLPQEVRERMEREAVATQMLAGVKLATHEGADK